MRIANAIWQSDATWASLSRTALLPMSALYSAATRVRNALYDRGTLRSVETRIPVVSVGNLAAGGAEKLRALLIQSWVSLSLNPRYEAVVAVGWVSLTLNPSYAAGTAN